MKIMVILCDRVSSSHLKSTCCFGQSNTKKMMMNTDDRTYTERRFLFFRDEVTTYRLYVYSLLVFFCTVISNCSAHSTVCDFNGSGLDLEGKEIQPVYLSCSSGRVEWRHPRSALRIVLQYPGENRDFRGCIKVSPEIEGARLFLEGHRSLVPLYSKGDDQPKERIRCFTSYHGLVALYLEADPSVGFSDLKASFEYDLQALPKGSAFDPLEECRPCSAAELVQFYCSADFAAKGFIISTEDDALLQQTKVVLAASKVFQQTAPVFSKEKSPSSLRKKKSHSTIDFNEDLHLNSISNEKLTESQMLFGHLFMPIECGARSGAGEFMVLGNMRFDQPVLRCAPRIEEWEKIVKNAQDRAHCVLES
ncbi:UNVERIFIED_CONTAM: hypothetical protein RMT77_000356 [Armadillidium vulgare]